MDIKEFSGKNVEDAITNAKVALGVTSDEINYEVVEKGSAGIFGIGAKDATVKVWLKSDEIEEETKDIQEEAKSESDSILEEEKASKKSERVVDDKAADVAKEFLADVFSAMKLDVEVITSVNEEDAVLDIDLQGPEMGVIIGKRGQTLDSLQYLTNLAVNRKVENYTRVKIDTEDYRNRRKKTLENLAKNMASKAKRTKRPVSLEAMNPYERRIIHAALQNDKYVTTHSEGEEPYRHVVITCNK